MNNREENKALPEGWREVRLDEVGNIVTGTTPSTEKTQYYKNGIYPFVTPTDISSHRVISKTGRYLTSEGLSKGRLISKGSLLVTCIASIGKNAILDSEGSCNQQINAIAPNKNYNVMYLYYLMENNVLYLTKFAGKSATAIINKKSFSNLEFIVPPLSEQKAIASLLETWDTAIEKTEALIAAKEKRFKWLLKTLISDQQDNPGWQKVKLGDIAKLYQSQTIPKKVMLKNGQYKVFGANGVIGFYNKYNHEEAEIAIVCRGATCGIVNMTDPKSWITGNAMVVKPNEERINKLYLYYFLSGTSLEICISGAAQPQITRKDLYPFLTVIPSLLEQKIIVAVLQTTQKEIDILKQLAEQYRTQKSGLMQKLLTGKCRIENSKKGHYNG